MLSPEQVRQIKSQILKQIENFPPEKREIARQQIDSMNSEQLEEFLEKNKLIKTKSSQSLQECIFCSIIQGDVPSYKIEENKNAIAVLEINPISKGHILIIPKKHIEFKEKIPKGLSSFAQKISRKIKSRLKPKPKEIKIYPSSLFGHNIINIFPIYEKETVDSERQHATQEQLKEIQEMLLKKKIVSKKIKRQKVEKIKPEDKHTGIWLPQRIP